MIHSYSNFLNLNKSEILNEGSEGRPTFIYWDEQFEKIRNKEWTEIKTYRYNADKYIIGFRAGDDKYNFYGIIVDHSDKSNELYYVENPKPVIEKFKNEFWKNPNTYVDDLKYDPTVLGDLSHIRDTKKYNL